MNNAVIVSAARTPVGSFGGSLAEVSAIELGRVAVTAALERAGGPDVDEVILGNVLQAGLGQNPARQVALASGLPDHVPALTLNRVCGSGLSAVIGAAQSIRLGDAECIVAGGTESMSQSPYLLQRARFGYRMGNGELVDSMIRDGLWCAMEDCHMGITAENVAADCGVSREDQDAFAALSQQRAGAAIAAGRFADEIVAVTVRQRKQEVVVDVDEHPRPDTTAERLAGLRPAFTAGGSVTAGNASGLNDGAAAVVVRSEEGARAAGQSPLVRIRGYAAIGVAPRVMGLGPVGAVRQALERAGVELAAVDLFELNEAFAAQSLAVVRELGVDPERVNVNGGAIALGHPIGASGCRILVTLIHEMRRRQVRLGVAGLCVGGGQGVAMVVEAV